MPEYLSPQETAPNSFEEQYKRVLEAAGCRTQIELATILEIRQSSISDAKRRQNIPAEWRVKLFEKKRINPEWILHGGEIKYLIPVGSSQNMPHVVRVTEVRPPKECSAQELFNELVRRALEKSADEQIQQDVAASWLPGCKTNSES